MARAYIKRFYPSSLSVANFITAFPLTTYSGNIGRNELVSFNACDNARPSWIPGAIRFGYDAINTSSTIASGTLISSVSAGVPNTTSYNFYGSNVVKLGTVFPDSTTVYRTAPTGATTDMAYGVDFNYDGSTFEYHYKTLAAGGRITVLIDGKLAGESIVAGVVSGSASGSIRYIRFYIPTAGTKNIKIFCEFNGFRGIVRQSGTTISKPSISATRMIVLGDSFTESLFSTNMFTGWAWRLGDLMGIVDRWNSGVGGTGYVNTGTAGRFKLSDRIVADCTNYNPDWIIFAMGINDTNLSQSTLLTEANLCFATAKANNPLAKIVVLGPFISNGNQPSTTVFINTRDNIKAAAISNSVDLFIDTFDGSWRKADGTTGNINNSLPFRTGAGYQGNYQATGNASLFVASDSTHPLEQAGRFDAYKVYLAIHDAGLI